MVSGTRLWRDLEQEYQIYDINCQYEKYLISRLRAMIPKLQGAQSISADEIRATMERTRIAMVPKYHVAAHEPACRDWFGPDYVPGAARTDGEAVERVWSDQNGLAARTGEMAEGHRHDTINAHHDDKNHQRTTGLCTCTSLL